jgi:pSer/pThr/pTyr-binding forkhead associated (FHA) protein
MKLSLVVLTPGKGEGKEIPIAVSPFIIGRDPQCHLRPASPVISKRHCALLIQDNKALVRDFDSTNGTVVNDKPVKGDAELHPDDRLQVGPLLFRVKLRGSTPVNKPTPPPPNKASGEASDDDAAATLLLDVADEDMTGSPSQPVDGEGIPTGSTIMEMLPPQIIGEEKPAKPEPEKPKPGRAKTGDTTSAAKSILDKYMRRTRG